MRITESHGQVRRPERVNQCTCPSDPYVPLTRKFFRFLKQELSFSHFLSTSDNGIKVILYMTLITAMLVMIYKRLNGIGYSDAKFYFKLQLEDWIIDLNVAIKTSGPEYKKVMQAVRNRIP